MIVRWNLTRTKRRYTGADAIVLSIGKSGRTWLKVLLNKYLSLQYNLPFELGNLSRHNKDIPSVVYSHEMWKHYTDATWDQRIRGKFIVPDNILFGKKAVLLYRDPRDVVVSLYYQKTKRSRKKINLSLSDFIKHKKYGIHNIINVMNKWRKRLKNHPGCHWISYEGIKADPVKELIKLLKFIGIDDIDEKTVQEAVAFADFENMKRLEAKGGFGSSILMPANPSDTDSFKVREGKVGGYKKHFSEDDIRYLNDALKKLDGFYGYRPDAS